MFKLLHIVGYEGVHYAPVQGTYFNFYLSLRGQQKKIQEMTGLFRSCLGAGLNAK